MKATFLYNKINKSGIEIANEKLLSEERTFCQYLRNA